jgi:hypothetical protein
MACTTHGLSREEGRTSRLYAIWSEMRHRCHNPNHRVFSNYGGRGINVCPEWENYAIFHKWAITNGYNKNLTIDRINNDGNYEPENCRWATMKEQQNNRRDNHLVSWDGQTKTLAQWAEERGLAPVTLATRLRRGWPVDRALTKPLQHHSISRSN